ncbi:MAG: CPBP family intramembrane metalloprotease, partial [Bryobacteraceae bacterium]|nr:CPBP family intramembrane metalloprotease [Bryobacteraceae bacterium]
GILHYLYFQPVGAALIALTGFATLRSLPADPAKLALTAFASFLGFLWVVALSEEFFVRGLLQQWLSKWMNSPVAGLLIASLIFGLLHLPFRSAFPNWRFALLAATASLFYGRAFQQAGSIRASMVTHALVVLTWRVFLV